MRNIIWSIVISIAVQCWSIVGAASASDNQSGCMYVAEMDEGNYYLEFSKIKNEFRLSDSMTSEYDICKYEAAYEGSLEVVDSNCALNKGDQLELIGAKHKTGCAEMIEMMSPWGSERMIFKFERKEK